MRLLKYLKTSQKNEASICPRNFITWTNGGQTPLFEASKHLIFLILCGLTNTQSPHSPCVEMMRQSYAFLNILMCFTRRVN